MEFIAIIGAIVAIVLVFSLRNRVALLEPAHRLPEPAACTAPDRALASRARTHARGAAAVG